MHCEMDKVLLNTGFVNLLSAVEHEAEILPRIVKLFFGSPIHWETLISPTVCDLTPTFRKAFCRMALKLFEKFECQDVHTIAQTFCVISSLNSTYGEFRKKVCDSCSSCFVSNVKDLVCLMKNNYTNICAGDSLDLVKSAYQEGDTDFLKILLRYGVPFIYNEDLTEYEEMKTSRVMLRLLSQSPEYKLTNWSLMDTLRDHYPQDSKNRIILLLIGLETFARKATTIHSTKQTECLRRIFETIPDPYISSSEIRKFLSHLLNLDEKHPLICEISDQYETEFPESIEQYQPRPLQHLSRCTIRQSLREAGALPHGIRHLRQLPTIIKRYVILEDLNDNFNIFNSDCVLTIVENCTKSM